MIKVKQSGKEFLVKEPPNKNVIVRRQRTCAYCGEPFLSNRRSAKYCSNSCKQKHYNWRKSN